MASSRNPPSAEPLAAARRALGTLDLKGRTVVVGLSGGVDSVVLLDLLRRLAPEAGFRLAAIHVNHGLSPSAPRWERHCRALCRAWRVPIRVRRVRVERRGRGLEAAARAARQGAFAAVDGDVLALAHHLDDQAETVLHNLLRGAGLRGASGMPALGALGSPGVSRIVGERGAAETAGRSRAKRVWRPLLEASRAAIEAYARREGLAWVEDESNADRALTRNFLRHEIGPRLAARFPRWRESLARAARLFAARDTARSDALRLVLAEHGLRAPSAARLADMLRQLGGARPGARVAIAHDGKVLRLHRGRLAVTEATPQSAFVPMAWRGEARLALPALGGELRFARGAGGIDPSRVPPGGLTVALRRGGERLRVRPGAPSRTLKNLFQEQGVPEWERSRLPMLYCGDRLVWAPGLGIDVAFATPAGARGWRPDWVATIAGKDRLLLQPRRPRR